MLVSVYVVAVLFVVSNVEARRDRVQRFNCTGRAETGVCRAAYRRWYYDTTEGECKEFTWGGCGGNDNRFSSKSACERQCKARSQDNCPLHNCMNYCQFGFQRDASNCRTCACRPDPSNIGPDVCPQIECPDVCQNGYQIDANGCTTCNCRPPVVNHRIARRAVVECPPVCRIGCQYGLRRDENGCAICDCLTREEACGTTARPQCAMHCPNGFKTDSKGCELCECRGSYNRSDAGRPQGGRGHHHHHSSRNDDRRDDRNDRRDDRNGRRGRPNSTESPAQFPSSETTTCPRMRCRLRCNNGFMKDSFGCNMCRCSSSSQRVTDRPTRRPHWSGRSTVNPTPVNCDNRPMCMMFCANGFKKGSDGCDICDCN